MAAGESSDMGVGGGEDQSHPLESAKWIEKSSPKVSIFMENKVESGLN